MILFLFVKLNPPFRRTCVPAGRNTQRLKIFGLLQSLKYVHHNGLKVM